MAAISTTGETATFHPIDAAAVHTLDAAAIHALDAAAVHALGTAEAVTAHRAISLACLPTATPTHLLAAQLVPAAMPASQLAALLALPLRHSCPSPST